jgi:hypothetical protein
MLKNNNLYAFAQEFIAFSIDGYETPCAAWYHAEQKLKDEAATAVDGGEKKDVAEEPSTRSSTKEKKSKKRVDKKMSKEDQQRAIKRFSDLVTSHRVVELLQAGPRASFGRDRWEGM